MNRSCVRMRESLERLGVPRVDILLCHDIGRLTHGEAHAARISEFLEGGYRAMRELRDAGAVRAIGIGVNEWEVCVELLQSMRTRLHPAGGPLHAARTARAGAVAAAVRRTGRVHHLRRAVQFGDSRRRLARRRAAHYNYAAPPAERDRARAPARSAVRGVFGAAAGRGVAVPARDIRASRAWSPAARTAPKRAIAPRCSRIRYRRVLARTA